LDQRAKTVAKKDPAAPAAPEKGAAPKDEPAKGAAPEPGKQVESPKWYREQISLKSTELEKATKRVQEMEAKVASFEKQGLDTKALTEQLEAREKAYEKAQAALAAAKYEKSPEYADKFEKPFNDAAEYAKQVVEQLRVEDGEEMRPAKWADFVKLYNLPPAEAEVMATQMFGASTAIVMRHLDKLRELDHNKRTAVTQWEATAGEREKQERAQEAQRREKINTAWKTTNDNLIENDPEAFGEKPDDEEGNALWKESLELVDKAYTGRDKMTPEELIVLDAHVRLRAAAFPRDQRTIALLKAENEELRSRLGEKSSSTPGKTKQAAAPAATPAKDWRQEMRELNLINP
jgi:hypothetical protein